MSMTQAAGQAYVSCRKNTSYQRKELRYQRDIFAVNRL